MTTLHDKVPAGLDRKETEMYRRLDPRRLPKHIAIIMDGNGRWAKRRHMPRVAGHRAGVTSVRSTVETAARIHIPALTLYAFSEENWKKRPASEVGFLMGLLSRYLKAEVPTLNKNNIRLEYIGRQHELPSDVQERMEWAREATSRNTGMVLTLALNYSARTLLAMAVSITCASMRTQFRAISIPGICPTPTWWCALRAKCGSAISSSGNWPTPRSTSPQHYGLIFADSTSSKALRNIRSASGAMAASITLPRNS